MTYNRFLSVTLRYKVLAVRYRHQRGIYEVFVEVRSEGTSKRLPPRWMFIAEIDDDLKEYARRWERTPASMVYWLHRVIRERDKKEKAKVS